MEHIQHGLAWWPTLIVLAVATVTDLSSRRIPNWLVLPFLLAGVVISPWRRDWDGIGQGFWHTSGHGFSWHGLGAEPGRAGDWFSDSWSSFLDGRHGRRGRETVRRDRGLDWPHAVVFSLWP